MSDRRLYRETHATFEAYCGERWGWTRGHAYRQMDAAAVAGALSPTGDIPASENQARAMLDLCGAQLPPHERAPRPSWGVGNSSTAASQQPRSSVGASVSIMCTVGGRGAQ